MKLKLCASLLLLTIALAFQLPAQESELGIKSFEDTKTKAAMGNAEAQFNLGVCYDKGEGVEKDAVEAVKWYRKSAEQNLALAQLTLGACFYSGDGVVKDQVEAAKWARKAAEQNDAMAQYILGHYCPVQISNKHWWF